MRQLVLCCPCGDERVRARGLCARCYRERRLNNKRFNGRRDAAIARDGRRCVLCRSERLIVHHRNRCEMVTLCVRCHPRIHRTLRPRFGTFDEATRQLWREQHPDLAEQIELKFNVNPPAPDPVQIDLFFSAQFSA